MNLFGLDSDRIYRLIGIAALYLLPVASLAGVAATFVLGMTNYLILSLYLAIPLIFASIAYKCLKPGAKQGRSMAAVSFKLLLIAYLVCYALSILLLMTSEVRPLTYFLVVVTMAVTVLVQITGFTQTRERIALILAQITGLVLNLNWGVTLNYFRFIGRTDVMIHTQYVNSVISTGHVTEVFFDYQAFPLWHILNAIMFLVGGGMFPADKVIALTGSLIYVCLPVLAYLVAFRIFKEQRTALIAALLMFFFPNLPYWGISGISSSIAAVLLVFLLYLLLGSDRKGLILIGLVTAAIIVYHSVTIIFVMVILAAFYVLQKILLAKGEQIPRIGLKYLVITAGATLAYWIFFGPILLEELYGNIQTRAPTGVVTKSVVDTPYSEIFNYLQYSPSIFFILIGVLALLLAARTDGRARLFALVAMIFMWLTYPGPLYLFNKLLYNFGIDRFAEYTPFLLALICAVGLSAMLYRSNRYVKACVILLFAVWVMLSITSDWVASDNPLVKRPFYTYYLTQDELSSFDHIASAASSNGMILTDFITTRYLQSYPEDLSYGILEVSNDSSRFYEQSPDDVLLIRDGELGRRPLKISVNDLGYYKVVPFIETFTYYYQDSPAWDALGGYDQVYDSKSVSGYV